jgi:ATP-dependent 26S proteasome regulatory subunit
METKQWMEKRRALPVDGLNETERDRHAQLMAKEAELLHIETAHDSELGLNRFLDSQSRQRARMHAQTWKMGEVLKLLHEQVDELHRREEVKDFIAGKAHIRPDEHTSVQHMLHTSRELTVLMRTMMAIDTQLSALEVDESKDEKIRKYYNELGGIMSRRIDASMLSPQSKHSDEPSSGLHGGQDRGSSIEEKKRQRKNRLGR